MIFLRSRINHAENAVNEIPTKGRIYPSRLQKYIKPERDAECKKAAEHFRGCVRQLNFVYSAFAGFSAVSLFSALGARAAFAGFSPLGACGFFSPAAASFSFFSAVSAFSPLASRLPKPRFSVR